MITKRTICRSTLIGLIALVPLSVAQPQKSGQSMQIQYGRVVASSYVQEKSDAGKAALVGGTVGYYSARNKSSSTKAASTAIGAGLAGGAKKRSEGSREARQYEIATATGAIVVISDQTEIHVDDCVAVEQAGQNANVRRVADTYCDPASAEVVSDIQDEAMEEAQECAAAKNELAAADSEDAFDQAFGKVQMLCDM